MSDSFASSDSIRSARPLAALQQVTFDQPLTLRRGGELPSVTVAYETYGQLNEGRDNAVLICHAISGDSHVARHDPDDDPGWWEEMVGPGKPIDTDRYFVICSNVLGGCRGTTGPGCIDPLKQRPYGPDFPLITVQDMVQAQRWLIDHMGIACLRAVLGGSLGGQQAMVWAVEHPEKVKWCIAIATTSRLSSQALAFDVVGRNAIMSDPGFHQGLYYDQQTRPDVGLAIARMLGHITYLSPQAMNQKFELDRHNPRDISTEFEKRFSVGSYLAYQGNRFVERFDANSYISISLAMDFFDLGQEVQTLTQELARSTCGWLVISFSSDWLFPPEQSRLIVDALIQAERCVTYCELPTPGGHDAFLLSDEISRFGRLVQAKLDGPVVQEVDYPVQAGGTSIFSSQRLDYERITQFIEPGASVLDLGCGRGGLLARIRQRDGKACGRLLGVDVMEEKIITAVTYGFDVIDLDLNAGLTAFPDHSFDVVTLSQTLQAVIHVEYALEEMMRVGRRAIVSFPNFAHAPLRKMLAEEGRSPRAPGWFDYQWYETPNRRYPTIADFDDYCRTRGIKVCDAVYLNHAVHEIVQPHQNPNLHADTAIYVLSR